MDTRIVSYTFDRRSGELLSQELKEERYNKPLYLEGVINTLLKGLDEYINKEYKDISCSL